MLLLLQVVCVGVFFFYQPLDRSIIVLVVKRFLKKTLFAIYSIKCDVFRLKFSFYHHPDYEEDKRDRESKWDRYNEIKNAMRERKNSVENRSSSLCSCFVFFDGEATAATVTAAAAAVGTLFFPFIQTLLRYLVFMCYIKLL